ncbi:hypothetical protein PENANT_c026G09190 [Penicillium antarcticum]|uniref:Xylanolytic transcriptional activator regulatory domain-containing protein n=1 Tax=Penicillium antarcticum TaxID=416450 RepID=A0A1V6PXA9_9EURO|nr:hypothetical protein PENANT_c026G09190 [Penicillium antarcticum]
MAATSIPEPVNCTLPLSSSGSSITKPIKPISKPCFGCDCGDEERPKVSRLSERISRIERLLAENLTQDQISEREDTPQSPQATTTASNSPSTHQPIDSSSARVHFAGKELGVISLLTGTPFLFPEGQAWIEARTGQKIPIDTLSPSRAPWEKERGQSFNTLLMNMNALSPFDLPDYGVLQAHLEAFKASKVMRRIFPIIDFDLFDETIKTAYKRPGPTFGYGQASARVCVIAFLTFISRLPHVKETLAALNIAPVDYDLLATRAQFLIPQVLQENPSLDAAQALTILTLVELSAGNMRATNYYGGITARLIFMLGGNVLNSQAYSFDKRRQQKDRQLRNLFWICYTMDKDIALRTGQPPTISDENCDLTLPPGYLERAFLDVEDEDAPFLGPVFPFDLRLSIIKARAHRELYSVSSLRKSDAELLKSIRVLDDELEEWRLSVPPAWRPTMSFSSETSDPNMGMHSVLLRLNYHLCMAIIHQASGRCKSWMEGQNGMMDGVSSSMALSVEASRSSLCYLEAAEHVVVDGVFWTLIFYPMSALLTIFCSILQNPLDPHSREDLDRLKVATVMMERIFSRKLPDSELVHFKMVADFVMELKRLAECAIDKAWAEQRASHMSK